MAQRSVTSALAAALLTLAGRSSQAPRAAPIGAIATAASAWRRALAAAAARLFPEFANPDACAVPRKDLKESTEVLSSLPFQVLIYCNIWFFPFWLIGSSLVMYWKITAFALSPWHKFMSLFMFAVFVLVEPVRLWLGYSGNTRERVPELSGCFVFSCFPQLVILAYLFGAQQLTGAGFALPFETAAHLVYIALIVPEAALGFAAGGRMVRAHAVRFALARAAAEAHRQQ